MVEGLNEFGWAGCCVSLLVLLSPPLMPTGPLGRLPQGLFIAAWLVCLCWRVSCGWGIRAGGCASDDELVDWEESLKRSVSCVLIPVGLKCVALGAGMLPDPE